MITVKILADSIAPNGCRLTTMLCRYPRMIHAEVMTYRMFSRNAGSSRAIPTSRRIREIREDPAIPPWYENQPGMTADQKITDVARLAELDQFWFDSAQEAIDTAQVLDQLKVHKSIINRLLEPFSHISVVISSTEWENFFFQRCNPLADPVMQKLADTMLDVYLRSIPRLTARGQWHLPFITEKEREDLEGEDLRRISAARCARASFENFENENTDYGLDIRLHDRLVSNGHWSPLEHQATPFSTPRFIANFRGWEQHRTNFIGESGDQGRSLMTLYKERQKVNDAR